MKSRTRRQLSLTWTDFLVIAATVLTFGAVLMANIPNDRASLRTNIQPTDEPIEIGALPNDPDLVRARITLANGGPWG